MISINNVTRSMSNSTSGNWPRGWMEVASMPLGLSSKGVKAGGSVTRDRDRLYATKGYKTPEFYEYDPASDKWTKKKPMALKSHHVAFTEMNGKIYAFGGFVPPTSGPPAWVPIDNAWEYDPAADSWKALAPMPTRRGSPVAVTVSHQPRCSRYQSTVRAMPARAASGARSTPSPGARPSSTCERPRTEHCCAALSAGRATRTWWGSAMMNCSTGCSRICSSANS